MTPLQWFRIFASEFSTVSDTDVAALIAAATLFVNTASFDADRANAAIALYAAHLKWVQTYRSGEEANHGAIKAEREGDLSRVYNSLSGDDSWLGQSPYGLQFIDITKALYGATIMTRFGGDVPDGAVFVDGNLEYYSSNYGPALYGN